MSCIFAAMAVQMITRRITTEPKAARDANLKLQQNMAHVAQLDKILPMAGWIHRRYSRILEREGDLDEARNVSISPPKIGLANCIAIPAIVPSQRTPPPPPPPPPQMRTITEEENNHSDNINGNSKPKDDEWGHDCEHLLNMEHTLTAPSMVLEHNMSMDGEENNGSASNFQKQRQHQHPVQPQQHQQPQGLREEYTHIWQENMDINGMQSEIHDFRWFMDNVGNEENFFRWSQTAQGR